MTNEYDATPTETGAPSALDDFLFDLNGFLIVRNAVPSTLVARLNAAADAIPRDLEFGQWIGNSQRRDYTKFTGLEMHNAVELGAPFEELLDNPAWIFYARHYCGEEAEYTEGLFVDECILSIRSAGGFIPVHSGGYKCPVRTQYRFDQGVWRCGQVNVILALTDIGEGDGSTMVIPGSHKSNLAHPSAGSYIADDRMDGLRGAFPVYLNKGDAVLFVDCLMHGGASRVNAGERRVTIYRYGPRWGATRFGFVYSDDLLARVTPERRKLLQPLGRNLPPEGTT